jgi:hypothetical protein
MRRIRFVNQKIRGISPSNWAYRILTCSDGVLIGVPGKKMETLITVGTND